MPRAPPIAKAERQVSSLRASGAQNRWHTRRPVSELRRDPGDWPRAAIWLETGLLCAGAQPRGHGLERLGEAASVEKFIPLTPPHG